MAIDVDMLMTFFATFIFINREEVRQMFLHSWESYMKNAFPADELRPISCSPRHRNDSDRGTLDHSLGGYALTLIDGLDTLAVMGETHRFRHGVLALLDAFSKEVIHFNSDYDIR